MNSFFITGSLQGFATKFEQKKRKIIKDSLEYHAKWKKIKMRIVKFRNCRKQSTLKIRPEPPDQEIRSHADLARQHGKALDSIRFFLEFDKD